MTTTTLPAGAGDPTRPAGAAEPAAPAGVGYLVALPHVLVAQDIAMTAEEFAPGAPVLLAATPRDALRALEAAGEGTRIAVAFVAEDPGTFAGSPLQKAIARRGGRAVLIGEAAEAEGPRQGFPVLQRPFGPRDVLRHLGGAADAA